MPFQKGNKLATGQGRKGYEYEEKQLKTMRSLFSKYLVIMEKVFEHTASNDDYAALQLLGPDIRKIMDKLHASKSESKEEVSLDLPFTIIEIEKNANNNETD